MDFEFVHRCNFNHVFTNELFIVYVYMYPPGTLNLYIFVAV